MYELTALHLFIGGCFDKKSLIGRDVFDIILMSVWNE